MAKKHAKHNTGLVILGVLALLFGGPPGLMLLIIVVVCVKLLGG